MSMKAPFIVNEAREALESGNSVVIGLQTTGEVRQPLQKQGTVITQATDVKQTDVKSEKKHSVVYIHVYYNKKATICTHMYKRE